MERKYVYIHGGMYEYILKESLYSAKQGYGWGNIQIYNNEKGMASMVIEDVEAMRLKLNNICDRLIEFIQNKQDYEYQYKITKQNKQSQRKYLEAGYKEGYNDAQKDMCGRFGNPSG